jgi:hypothetical protein
MGWEIGCDQMRRGTAPGGLTDAERLSKSSIKPATAASFTSIAGDEKDKEWPDDDGGVQDAWRIAALCPTWQQR